MAEEKKRNKFPKGNEFWKNRITIGRPKFFETPDSLLDAAIKYFRWAKKHPWTKNELIKSGPYAGKALGVPVARPLTLAGFCVYHGTNSKYFNDLKDGLKGKVDEASSAFSEVIAYIEETIRTQKFEGAAIGAFNANIISRDLGLIERKDITTDDQSINEGFFAYIRALKTKKSEDATPGT